MTSNNSNQNENNNSEDNGTSGAEYAATATSSFFTVLSESIDVAPAKRMFGSISHAFSFGSELIAGEGEFTWGSAGRLASAALASTLASYAFTALVPFTLAQITATGVSFLAILGTAFYLGGFATVVGVAGIAGAFLYNELIGLFGNPETSPIILDLNQDGVQLTNLNSSNAFFDLDADGFAENTGWVSAEDGILAIDKNNNGRVDDINEVFGNTTTDGFTELAPYDTNGDLKISAEDVQFTQLRVWVDANQNGFTDAGELKTLEELGIESIDLNATLVDEDRAGNSITHISTFTKTDGTTHEVVDAWFANDQHLTAYIPPDDFQYHADVSRLPQLRGYGEIPDLWVAMSLDDTLRQQVTDLVTTSTQSLSDFYAGIETMLFRWTGVQDMAPDALGTHVDSRIIAAFEAYMGQTYNDGNGTGPVYSGVFKASWVGLVNAIGLRLLTQIPNLPMQSAFADITNELWALENAGTDPSALTDQEMETLISPILLAGQQAFNTHPLKEFASLEFNYAEDSVSGNFADLLASLVGQLQDPNPQFSAQDVAIILRMFKTDFFADELDFETQVTNAAQSNNVPESIYGSILTYSSVLDRLLANYKLAGSDFDNTLVGASYADEVLEGNGGNDILEGGYGNDLYLWRMGDGNDVITENGRAETQDTDFLYLDEQTIADVSLYRPFANTDDLKITMNASGETLTISGQFHYGNNSIEQLVFSDGTALDKGLMETLAVFRGTSADESITGLSNDEIFDGQGGDDTINGHYGSDTYLFGVGSGNDWIDDWAHFSSDDLDKLRVTGLNVDDILFSRALADGNDLEVEIKSTGEKVTINDHFYGDDYGLEHFEFADGTVLDRAHVATVAEYRPTDGDDTINGTWRDETFASSAGNDTLTSGSMWDQDAFDFRDDIGHDTITDFYPSYGSKDTIVIRDMPVSTYEALMDITEQVGNDTVMTFDANNSITLQNVSKSWLYEDDFNFV